MNSRRIQRLFKLTLLVISGLVAIHYIRQNFMNHTTSSTNDEHISLDDEGRRVGGRGDHENVDKQNVDVVVDKVVDVDIVQQKDDITDSPAAVVVVVDSHSNSSSNNKQQQQHIDSKQQQQDNNVRKPKSMSSVDLREFTLIINTEHLILNKQKFSNRSTGENELIFIVQVHNRADYLIHLINSLRSVRGIEDVLLIFSHDYYNVKIFDMIQTIDFCQVSQIFFPFSMQIYSNTFPGQSDTDCPRDITKSDAIKIGCNNAQYPDMYGHYREASFTMTKHHWFWKLSTVFDELPMTKDSKGLVVLIEEDHYLLPDAVYMIKTMDAERKRRGCCDIISLGDYNTAAYETNHNKVDLKMWDSKAHNMAMVLDQKSWFKIKNCANMFCQYDDYNWDWSLQQLSKNCLQQPLTVIISKLPRCIHIGDCGMHHDNKGSDCNPASRISSINHDTKQYERLLFPDKISVLSQAVTTGKKYTIKANGGWGDIRDHSLCLGFVGKSLEKNKH